MKKTCLMIAIIGVLGTQFALAETVRGRFPRAPHSKAETFTRMFPDLPPFAAQTDDMRTAASQLGALGGPLDAGDINQDPFLSLANQAEFSPNNFDNPDMSAGLTFVGQFLDHDITFDRRSAIAALADPNRTVNFRSAAFDLDQVYGEGPQGSPELYDQTGTDIKFIVEAIPGSENVSRGGVTRYDLPRNELGEATMGDSRDDENVIVSQFHLAMLKFHNAITDSIRATAGNEALSAGQVFEMARQQVRWHYQWIILHEFLPQTIGADRLAQILSTGPRFYQVGTRGQGRNGGRAAEPQLPMEFSAAAYRFGHSQVRPSYRLNFGADEDSQFFAFVLNNRIDPNALDPDDLRGGRRAPRRFVDWQTFFDFGDGEVRNNKLIDTKISTVLFELPGTVVPAPGLPSDGVISLASRNLIRHVNFGLPSGQAIAREMGFEPLAATDLIELAPYGMAESSPLWYYVLKEAEFIEQGRRLGPVGGTIVGEVFVALLQADPDSYLSRQPDWSPTLPSRQGAGNFTIADMLSYAGVVSAL